MTSRIHHFLSPLLFLLPFASLHGAETKASTRPNILLVFIDDLGWGDSSCFGNKDAVTTNIDQLAKEGITFKQFVVNSPICSPSYVNLWPDDVHTPMFPRLDQWGDGKNKTLYHAVRKNMDKQLLEWKESMPADKSSIKK